MSLRSGSTERCASQLKSPWRQQQSVLAAWLTFVPAARFLLNSKNLLPACYQQHNECPVDPLKVTRVLLLCYAMLCCAVLPSGLLLGAVQAGGAARGELAKGFHPRPYSTLQHSAVARGTGTLSPALKSLSRHVSPQNVLWGPPVVPKWEAGRVLWRFSLNARVQGAGWLLVWALKEGQHN